jgi:hypothetical protein
MAWGRRFLTFCKALDPSVNGVGTMNLVLFIDLDSGRHHL